ncbi:MAG TPA: MOSC domain-containing protein [Actinomycetes bacterium]|nr:MOSC domain-containing protein [Actinomycetes bacterium]
MSGRRGPLTGRTRHDLLTLPAATGQNGVPLVEGHPWDSTEAATAIRGRAGPDARLVADTTRERFDVLNLLVATDGAVDRLRADVRRLRPNIVLAGVPADVEPLLPGQELVIGDAVVSLHSVRQRCIVTTIDSVTGEQDLDVLRRIHDVFGGELALNAWVIRPGVVQVGDAARVIPSPGLIWVRPVRAGGSSRPASRRPTHVARRPLGRCVTLPRAVERARQHLGWVVFSC